ncbi:MAG: hypothetical protein AAGN66_20175 [Acidobacteriota bacterium]
MRRLPVSMVILVGLLALPASLTFAAESPAEASEIASSPDAAADLEAPSDDVASSGTTRATCQATCGDTGGSVSISCSGSCTAVDQDCPSQRGYVECNGQPSTRKNCGECIPCFAESFCPDGGSVWCSGWGFRCIGGDDLCFVSCNNNVTFCPGHFGQLVCTDNGFGF